jgi:hypothetical protein
LKPNPVDSVRVQQVYEAFQKIDERLTSARTINFLSFTFKTGLIIILFVETLEITANNEWEGQTLIAEELKDKWLRQMEWDEYLRDVVKAYHCRKKSKIDIHLKNDCVLMTMF